MSTELKKVLEKGTWTHVRHLHKPCGGFVTAVGEDTNSKGISTDSLINIVKKKSFYIKGNKNNRLESLKLGKLTQWCLSWGKTSQETLKDEGKPQQFSQGELLICLAKI